jgi:uncharacterized protein YbjT (DUF2867 family)
MLKPMEVLVTGGTGYIGRALIARSVARGHHVRALARTSSLGRVPAGANAVAGDALDAASIAAVLRPGDTLVHLVGTPHPNPSKAREFQEVDLISIGASVAAALRVRPAHVIYVSVAQPAPVMRAYVAARAQGEQSIAQARLTATILRPWYVLGPGHWWPVVLLPVYKLAEAFPSTRASAERLGLVTLDQMINALVFAVESPPPPGEIRILDVPAIKRAPKTSGAAKRL